MPDVIPILSHSTFTTTPQEKYNYPVFADIGPVAQRSKNLVKITWFGEAGEELSFQLKPIRLQGTKSVYTMLPESLH